jgi:hypothetical protein
VTRVSKRLPALLLLLFALAGCARSAGNPAGSPTPAPGDVAVVVHRTGGIAGFDDTVTVEPDGRWTATYRRASARSGQLTDTQSDRLRTLTADPGLSKEAGTSPGTTRCADAFNYTVTVGANRVAYTDCPTDKALPPVACAIAQRVVALIRP